jgi:phage recombination protein Bet
MENQPTEKKQNTIAYTRDQIDLIKRQICKGASDDELQMFMHVAKKAGLDPFTRQIYSIQRTEWDPQTKSKTIKMTTQISIDGARLIAERSGKYGGQLGPFWCDGFGKWQDVWLKKESPSAAKVGVLRNDFKEPLWAVARFDSYAGRKSDGSLTKMWADKGDIMIAKCAESLALRKAFPQDLSGLYTTEEMPDAKDIDTNVDAPEKANVSDQAESFDDFDKAFAPRPTPKDTSFISEEDRKELDTLRIEAKWAPIDVKDYMSTTWGVMLSRNLQSWQFDLLKEHIKSNPRR